MTDFSATKNRDNRFLLTTLGSFRLDLVEPGDAAALSSLAPGKPLAVIAYLASIPGHQATRDRLCDLLWGDRDLEDAKAQLRQAIWLAKRQLGISPIKSVGTSIQLAIPLAVDVEMFATAAAAGDLEEAVSRYTGDFLAQFASPGAGEFERWAELERLRLRATFAHAAEALARRHLDVGRFKTAERVARRVRDLVPHSQLGWRLLVEALTAGGDTVTARAEADHFEAWLAEVSQNPEPASAAALRSARRASEPARTPRPGLEPELVGREHEFSTIHSLWSGLASTGGQIVRITAPSGLGKSRLAADLCSRIRGSRGRAVIRRANPGDHQLPFSLAAALAGDLAALPGARGISRDSASVLVALNPALSSHFDVKPDVSVGDEALRRRGYALLELISAVAGEAPLALIIDDLHWMDEASRQCLDLIAARLESNPVLLVTTSRRSDVPRSGELSINISLPPLTRDHVEQLMSSMASLPDASWAVGLPTLLVACSTGNPLVILESIRLCLGMEVLRIEGSVWSCADAARLRDLLQQKTILSHRLDALPELELRLLSLAALAGVPLPTAVLTTAAETEAAATIEALSSLEQRGLLSVVADVATIVHDALAERAIERLQPATIARLNDALGQGMVCLEGREWRSRAAKHFAEAANWPCAAESLMPQVPRYPTKRDLQLAIAASLGDRATPGSVRAIVQAMPVRTRVGRSLVRGLGVAALMTGIVAVVAFARHPGSKPDVSVFVTDQAADSIGTIERFDIAQPDWPLAATTGGLRPIESTRVRLPTTTAGPGLGIVFRPGSDQWAEWFPGDSGGLDMRLCDPAGCRGLTLNPHDNVPNSFSPDGAQLAFHTSRWSSVGHTSIAVMDLRTHAIRRMTSGPGSDVYAEWSPDGTRLAFTRHSFTGEADRICVMAAGATGPATCMPVGRVEAIAGWVDPERLLITVDTPAEFRSRLAFFDTRDGSLTASDFPRADGAQLDETGRWLLFASAKPAGGTDWQLAPVEHPELARTIVTTGPGHGAAWLRASGEPDYLASIAIQAPSVVVQGVPYKFGTSGTLKSGELTAPSEISWTTNDSSRATIDSLGVFVARKTGVVVVTASAGGWRETLDSVHVVVGGTAPKLFTENWSDNPRSRWGFFGIPFPAVDRVGSADFFFNNGDGSFDSGAYTLRGFSAAGGLSLDLRFSAPITAVQWQRLAVEMNAVSDTSRLMRWNRRTGWLDEYFGVSRCAFSYPASEGVGSRDRAAGIGVLRDTLGRPMHLWDGRWTELRLQLFPDGRCGIALNGLPYLIQPARGPRNVPVYVAIMGASARTRVLVGDVTIRAGVPTDMDWTRLTYRDGVWERRESSDKAHK